MRTSTTLRLTALAILAVPALLAAQGRPGAVRMMVDGPGRAPDQANVTRILNARRVLDLTPRQVAQLDSIERSVYAERRANQTRNQAFRDSIRRQFESQPAPATEAEREQRRNAVRQRLEALRPQMQQMRTRDSVAGAAALRVLNDAQRQQLREIQAEARGRAQAMRQMRERGAMRGGPRSGPRGGGMRMMRRDGGPDGAGVAPGERRMIEERQMRERRPAGRPDDGI